MCVFTIIRSMAGSGGDTGTAVMGGQSQWDIRLGPRRGGFYCRELLCIVGYTMMSSGDKTTSTKVFPFAKVQEYFVGHTIMHVCYGINNATCVK